MLSSELDRSPFMICQHWSYNSLVPSGNKSLAEPILTQTDFMFCRIYCAYYFVNSSLLTNTVSFPWNESTTKSNTKMHLCQSLWSHDVVIKWKHFPRYWPFVRGIHRHPWIPPPPPTKASDAEFWCFLWSWGWWFERPSRSIWRHCKVMLIQLIAWRRLHVLRNPGVK